MRSRTFILFAVITFTGCSVGPDYTPPEMSLPEQFTESSPNPAIASVDLTRWWTTFNDPLLEKLIAEAVESNLDVELATARIREARGLLSLSRSGFFPFPELTGSFSRSRTSKNARQQNFDNSNSGSTGSTAVGGKTTNLYAVGFDASWEIDIFGGVRREVEVAYGTYEAQIESRRNALVTLLAEVATNYLALRSAQKRYDITESNVAAQRETLELQKIRLDVGLTNELTVSQAEAQLENTASQLPALELPIRQAIHRLGVLLGKNPGALSEELSKATPIPSGPLQIPAGLPSELLKRRPDVREAERQLASATASIGVATADLFPKFELTGSLGVRSMASSSLFEGGSKYWSAGPSISWDILNWYAILSNIEVQNARQEQALITYKKTALEALEEVENALVAFRSEQQKRERLEQSAIASKEALDLALRLNKAGIVDFLNVLTAQFTVFASEDRLVQSDQAVATNLVSLYKALGGGWETTESDGVAIRSD